MLTHCKENIHYFCLNRLHESFVRIPGRGVCWPRHNYPLTEIKERKKEKTNSNCIENICLCGKQNWICTFSSQQFQLNQPIIRFKQEKKYSSIALGASSARHNIIFAFSFMRSRVRLLNCSLHIIHLMFQIGCCLSALDHGRMDSAHTTHTHTRSVRYEHRW